MADITEQQEVAQQISDAISRPVGFGDDVDEVIGSEGSGNFGENMSQPRRKAQEDSGAHLQGNAKRGLLIEIEVSFLWLQKSCPYPG